MKSCVSLEQEQVTIDSIHTIFSAVNLIWLEKIRSPPVYLVSQLQQAVKILWRTDLTVFCPSRVAAVGFSMPQNSWRSALPLASDIERDRARRVLDFAGKRAPTTLVALWEGVWGLGPSSGNVCHKFPDTYAYCSRLHVLLYVEFTRVRCRSWASNKPWSNKCKKKMKETCILVYVCVDKSDPDKAGFSMSRTNFRERVYFWTFLHTQTRIRISTSRKFLVRNPN